MKRIFALLAFLMFAVPSAFASIDTIAVDVGISVFKTMPIGVVPFAEPKGRVSWSEEKPHEIVTRDANLSGRFDVIASDKFNLALFSRNRAKHYITGKATVLSDGRVQLDCWPPVFSNRNITCTGRPLRNTPLSCEARAS